MKLTIIFALVLFGSIAFAAGEQAPGLGENPQMDITQCEPCVKAKEAASSERQVGKSTTVNPQGDRQGSSAVKK